MEDDKIVGGIPFPDDLLFHFFNKKTVIADTYIQDPISELKLYPMKSPAVKPTIASTGFKIAKETLANARKCVFVFHHKLADLVAGYVGFAKEYSVPVGGNYGTFAMYLNSGKIQYQLYYGDSSTANINVSSLTDDSYYKVTAIWNGTNHSFKFEKLTRVNNVVTLGTAVNSTVGTSGTVADIDLGILAANYSNGSLANGSKAKICCMQFFDASDNCIVHIPFSEGTGNLLTDVCNGTTYTVLNETDFATFRNYTQDFSFYNFRYGFTLYQKSGSPDLRIPNKEDGTEIIPATIPSGYSRTANYKECKTTFNQCESLFKLDDVSVGGTGLTIANATGIPAVNGSYNYNGLYLSNPSWFNSDKNIVVRRESGYWCIRNLSTILLYSSPTILQSDPKDVPYWTGSYGNATLVITNFTVAPSALYSADPDFILFTESTGIAKEFSITGMDFNYDRGYLYINSDVQETNFMLYGTDKTLTNDLKVLKYVERIDRVSYDEETGLPNYDENNHAELTE